LPAHALLLLIMRLLRQDLQVQALVAQAEAA
jgi:hypothetical protein